MPLQKKLYPIKRALISVSDKNNLLVLAQALAAQKVELIASGGTAASLLEAGFKVTPIEEVTSNPKESFGGRMKTLSFQVSSALLYRRGNLDDEKQAQALNIRPIDLVVVNFYPFAETLKQTSNLAELIEKIDVGGPTMVRSAAKNFESVCVLTRPEDYPLFLQEFEQYSGQTTLDLREKMATLAFGLTADYDALIAQTLRTKLAPDLGPMVHIDTAFAGQKVRYGENPHQAAWVFKNPLQTQSLAAAQSLQGKELSFNNYKDADAALRALEDIHHAYPNEKAAVIVKHGNPCGAAISQELNNAFDLAWKSDPVSSFGSIVALNTLVDDQLAQLMSDRFIEVILAPSFSAKAKSILGQKKNLRLIEVDLKPHRKQDFLVTSIDGGFLLQNEDAEFSKEHQQVTQRKFSKEIEKLKSLGLSVAKHLKSNAIAIVGPTLNGHALWGAGMGNPNRLVSLEQAYQKALENGYQDFSNCLLVSDAFFPFSDTLEKASQCGIQYIIQPGGSIKDKEVIAKADQLKIAMLFTGRRHFRH